MTTRLPIKHETLNDINVRKMREFVDAMGGLDEALASHVIEVNELKTQRDAVNAIRAVYASVTHPDQYHISSDVLPLAARKLLMASSRTPERCWSSYKAFLAFPPHAGQTGWDNKNILLIVEPYWGDPDGKYVSIEMGCAHKFEGRKLGNCYYSYSCTECGYVYQVDSGD